MPMHAVRLMLVGTALGLVGCGGAGGASAINRTGPTGPPSLDANRGAPIHSPTAASGATSPSPAQQPTPVALGSPNAAPASPRSAEACSPSAYRVVLQAEGTDGDTNTQSFSATCGFDVTWSVGASSFPNSLTITLLDAATKAKRAVLLNGANLQAGAQSGVHVSGSGAFVLDVRSSGCPWSISAKS